MGAGAIAWREMVAKLKTLGFDGPHKKGRGPHSFMRRGNFKLRIPNRHGSAISGPLVDRLLDQAGISLEDWENA